MTFEPTGPGGIAPIGLVSPTAVRTLSGLVHWIFGGRAGLCAWSPTTNIVESDSAYILEVELPGVRREDVDIALNGNEFVVTGGVKERKHKELFCRRTRRVGEFDFRATLPRDLRPEGIEASVAYDVLRDFVRRRSAPSRARP